MSRETKVGLIVAFSFLLLVGSVVFYKLYVTEPTMEEGEEVAATQTEGSKPAGSPSKPAARMEVPAEQKGTGPAGVPGGEKVAANDAPPPPENPGDDKLSPSGRPGFAGRPDNRPPALPPGFQESSGLATKPGMASGRPDLSPSSEKPGLSLMADPRLGGRPMSDLPPLPEQPGKKDQSPALAKDLQPDLPPLPEEPQRGGARPGLEEKPGFGSAPALTGRPTSSGADEKSGAEFGGRPMPPGAGKPSFEIRSPPAPERPAAAGTDRPDLPPAEPSARGGDPMSPPVEAPRPGGASESPVPLTLPPEARGVEVKPREPMPPLPESPAPTGGPPRTDAFDRRYDPPASLGKPMLDPSRRDDRPGTPVEIRRQPDLDSVPSAGGVRSPGNVLIYDREVYNVRPGDTFATISNLKYGSPQYAEALALYNREQNPRMTTPVAGQSVFVPPADVLERKYRSAIGGGAAEGGAVGSGGRDLATAFPSREARPATPPADRNFPANGLSDKRYRVRTGDTLWNIAKQTLGSGERWTEIMRLNRDLLPDINRLQDGLLLRLPIDAKVDTLAPSP